jgi:hypothetical protein
MRTRENSNSSLANDRVDKAVVPAMPPKRGRKGKTATNVTSTDQQPLNGSNNTTVVTTSQPTTSMETVDDICSRGDHNQDAGQQKLCAVFTDEISVCRQVITTQQEEIRKLRCQLNYVLSYLEIIDVIEEMSHEANQPALNDVSPLATHVDSLNRSACW